MLAFYDRYLWSYLGWFWSFLFVTITITVMNIFFVRSDFLTALLAIAIAVIYSLYLVIDTQLVLDREGTGLTLDNYVLGAVLLYIDIIQLFIQILKVLGEKKKWSTYHWFYQLYKERSWGQ